MCRRPCSLSESGLLSRTLMPTYITRFLLIVSRVARLLECLEFDPLEFCQLLEAAEAQAKQVIKIPDIPKYIISKLGLNRDPLAEFAASLSGGGEVAAKARGHSGEENGADASMASSLSASTSRLMGRRAEAPCEDDFEQIKLISNGAYG